MKKGFTLVELAIVLVVIGLLMGMAFKGKSLVDAARTKADIRKIQKMETALNTYFAKYDTLPGKKSDGTYSDKSMVDELIADGSLNQADFKLASFASYIHFTGCEERIIQGGPVFYPVDIDVNQRLCVTLTPHSNHTDSAVVDEVTAVKELYICYIETLLDDSDILTGSARKTTFRHDGSSRTYKDCSALADNVATGDGSGFAYLIQVY